MMKVVKNSIVFCSLVQLLFKISTVCLNASLKSVAFEGTEQTFVYQWDVAGCSVSMSWCFQPSLRFLS